jgi:Zn-dependent membrane protease YugP
MFYGFDYWLFALPGLLLGLWAQTSLQGTFRRYAAVPTSSGVTGADVAQLFMQRTGVQVGVKSTPKPLGDFYDPASKTLNLSPTSAQNSIASVAVVAHEFGHAMQDAQHFGPLKLRSAIVPAVQVGSWVGPTLFLIGYWLNNLSLAWVGILFFAATALFAIATLPVELNASNRAMQLLATNNVLAGQELTGARKVLNAAALTYVAAIVQSVLTVLYYVSILAGRRRS